MKNLRILLIGLSLVLIMVSSSLAATLTIPISSSTDDHEETYGGANNPNSINSPDLDLGQYRVGLRFQDIQILQNTLITSATLKFTHLSGGGSLRLTIRGQDASTPPTFSTSSYNLRNRWSYYETNASTSWDVGNDWNNGVVSITSIVQEIIDRSDWAAGGNIVLMLSERENKDDEGLRTVYSYDGSDHSVNLDGSPTAANYAPTLIIEYGVATTAESGICQADIRINDNLDDAEQDGSTIDNNNATMPWGSRWLGLKFNGVPIPQGASVNEARIYLATGASSNYDSYNEESDGRAKVKIYGNKTANAGNFSSGNISGRPKTSTTAIWSNDRDWNDYLRIRDNSPDISDIVKEIVLQDTWQTGNSMAFLLEDISGRRPALAHDDTTNGAAYAARLHVEWECTAVAGVGQAEIQVAVNGSSDSADLNASAYQADTSNPTDTITITNLGDAELSYTFSQLPTWLTLTDSDGVVITRSSVAAARTLATATSESFTATYLVKPDGTTPLATGDYAVVLTVSDPASSNQTKTINARFTMLAEPDLTSSCSNVPLYIQNRVSPAVLINLDLSGSMTTEKMAVVGDITLSETPDLTTIVQEIVNRPGWNPGQDMAFIIEGSGDRRAKSYNKDTSAAPLLVVEYTSDAVAATTSVRVSNGDDDAEQDSNGANFSATQDVLNLGDRVVGLRFQSLDIPNSAVITNAYIQFTPDSATSGATSLTIYGEATDDAVKFSSNSQITTRTKTTEGTKVGWPAVPAWEAPTQETRLAIAQSVIKKIVENRNINWGYGSWESGNPVADDYTKIEVGCNVNDDTHLAAIKAAVDGAYRGGYTPFVPSIDAATDYLTGGRADLFYNSNFDGLSCQDKFVIEITDGLGNRPTGTSAAAATTATANMMTTANGISAVAVGFGIDDASMINAVAQKANELGSASETDNLYALHEEEGSPAIGVPFLATDKDQLLSSLLSITHKIENRFTGSAPAPTTSADDADLLLVLVAEYGSASWTGDLRAFGYSLLTNDWSGTEDAPADIELWRASEMIPDVRNIWTAAANANGTKIIASDATSGLTSSNYLCKDIGDIINSAPIIVKWPNFHYNIDGYRAFYLDNLTRDKMVYVGANDGQLHAFLLTDSSDGTAAGTEAWSFIPPYLHEKLNLADSDNSYDICETAYCHQYYVDGSPQSADIYVGDAWHTILVTGLREGGEAYFALDITDGLPMADSADTGAQYLWQFTDDELGQTWGDARINRVVDESDTPTDNGKIWGTFMGSGYSTSNQLTKEAYLFGIDAYDASPLWKTSANVATNRIKMAAATLENDALSELLVVDKDYDSNFAADFIYAGNLYGDLYRVGNIGKGQTPVVSILYESNNTERIQPIRGRPSAAFAATKGEFWIYFGTGRYEVTADKASTDPQYFFGLKEKIDPATPGSYTTKYVKPATLDNAAVSTRLAANGSPADLKLVALDATEYTVAGKLVKTITGENPLYDPWVIRLGTTNYAERVTSQPLVVGGVVFFTSFIPDDDLCGGSGSSFLYAVDYRTGLAPATTVFDLNGDGVYNDADKIDPNNTGDPVNVAAISLGQGQASQPVIVGDKIFTTTTAPGRTDDPDNADDNEIPIELPIGVSIKGLRASLDSWFDASFE